MKKRALCLLLAAVLAVSLLPLTARAAGDVAINETNFPDATFRQYVADRFDTDNSGDLSETEIAAVTRIYCGDKGIRSLKGIEFFPSLWGLYCGGNPLNELDVSKNLVLEELSCSACQIKSLDVSKNTALTYLNVANNQLSSLNIGKNTALTSLVCSENQLSKLDISKNSLLKTTFCWGNQITKLDIGNNPGLIRAILNGKKTEEAEYISYELSSGGNGYFVRVDAYTQLTGYLPAITTQPASKTVAAGKSVTFSVKATGAELQYQWQVKKGSGDWTNLSGKTSAKLTLTMKKSMDGYKYRCIVSNEAGKATSSAAKLTLMVKPRITTQPKSAKVKAGNSVTFKVKATGGALKYQWYWAKPGSNVWTKVSGGTKASLKISAKKSLTGRRYRCQVKNAVGTVYTKAVTLSVY